MKIMFLLNEDTQKVTAEWCADGYTLEQLQDLWPSQQPGRCRERIIALSERQYVASEHIDGFLKASAEAFEVGRQYGVGRLLVHKEHERNLVGALARETALDDSLE